VGYGAAVKDWEVIADNLSKSGWSWGCVSAIDSQGRTIWIVDAHRDDGRRFIVRADEILSAFVELERDVLTITFYLESISLGDSLHDEQMADSGLALRTKSKSEIRPAYIMALKCSKRASRRIPKRVSRVGGHIINDKDMITRENIVPLLR
jgi:hypothetical protein